ncbi:hypothetical protein K435DRAFT_863215 [Dendrothele bispora CBS 962.96]|uniref:Uncharacterized protein n=1 Tax=Dendrothele bispora (strain CBS 962.96) TaxID=1314807 RepID=A0A4S8LQC2_DENBC|nr:hypothetical protein K435DRAFT_863215 [Dendrothele bispora CBS 962.96]
MSSEESSESQPQFIRITKGGKIKAWVSFSLQSLETSESRPLVLHTLPATIKLDPATGNSLPLQQQPENDNQKDPAQSTNPVSTTPRLISVVEIIKREYLKSLAQKRSPRRIGLHQYNEIGILEDLSVSASDGICRTNNGDQHNEGRDEEDRDARNHKVDAQKQMDRERHRQESIALALEGKNFPKQKQTPYMKITLSASELPELVKRGATYQSPQIRRLTKSAKARARKSQKKQQAQTQVDTDKQLQATTSGD